MFSFPLLCSLFFSDGDHFLFPNGSSLMCCACFVPAQPRAGSWRGRAQARRGRAAGREPRGRGRRREAEPGRSLFPARPLQPVTRAAPVAGAARFCSAGGSLPRLPALLASVPGQLPPRELKTGRPGHEVAHSGTARAPGLLPACLPRPRWGGAGGAVPKGAKELKPPASARKPGKEG